MSVTVNVTNFHNVFDPQNRLHLIGGEVFLLSDQCSLLLFLNLSLA